ncbi:MULTISPECIES: hypothetical protein [Burkholderia]|uniref:hypothetical protein n=1 Tax=Burkholderia TaxID=32008 RepID=UPI00215607C9|nr:MULTISPECIES: hypothetical protein [Burkholderia]MEB2531067.1 hypothetical protein [Burkholderia anthinoferrum]
MQERVSPDIVRAAQAGLIDVGIVAGGVLLTLRRRIQVGNFETACRMIEANVACCPKAPRAVMRRRWRRASSRSKTTGPSAGCRSARRSRCASAFRARFRRPARRGRTRPAGLIRMRSSGNQRFARQLPLRRHGKPRCTISSDDP